MGYDSSFCRSWSRRFPKDCCRNGLHCISVCDAWYCDRVPSAFQGLSSERRCSSTSDTRLIDQVSQERMDEDSSQRIGVIQNSNHTSLSTLESPHQHPVINNILVTSGIIPVSTPESATTTTRARRPPTPQPHPSPKVAWTCLAWIFADINRNTYLWKH